MYFDDEPRIFFLHFKKEKKIILFGLLLKIELILTLLSYNYTIIWITIIHSPIDQYDSGPVGGLGPVY